MATEKPVRTVVLDFDRKGQAARRSLSAVDIIEDSMWLAVDELAAMHRLVAQPDGSFGDHKSFPLAEYFCLLPRAEADPEVDLEGLGVDRRNRRLWLTGSHSLSRPKPGEEPATTCGPNGLVCPGNRQLLGYMPLEEQGGVLTPAKGRCAAMKFDLKSGTLRNLLAADDMIAPFLALPAKENGLDIEGLAVDGMRVFLGLRGPVVRDLGLVLQLDLEEATPGVLTVRPAGGRPYLRHRLDLDGLGVRDLCIADKRDLLILAGPTMPIHRGMRLYRWRNALGETTEQRPRLERLFDIDEDGGRDHAEGICIVPSEGEAADHQLLVVYDQPSGDRLRHGNKVRADLFAI